MGLGLENLKRATWARAKHCGLGDWPTSGFCQRRGWTKLMDRSNVVSRRLCWETEGRWEVHVSHSGEGVQFFYEAVCNS